jgi:hypothetical protein
MSGLQKNVASQKWVVFAFDETDNTPVTGDAANITGKISIEWGTLNAITDTNPTEQEDGYYVFDLTQAETNGDVLNIYPESSTPNTRVIGVPGTIYTVAQYFPDFNLTSSGNSGIDWANVENPTSTVSATNTTIGVVQQVDGLGTGVIDAASIAANAITAAKIANDTITAAKFDESTAFPLTATDSGATTVAREGADGSTHTLATLSSQIGGISGGGSAVSIDAESYTLTTGTQTTNTFAATSNIDGTYHGITNAAGTLDYYYVMDIGTNATPVEVSINGRLDEGSPPSGDDTVDIVAYNNDTTSFEVVKGVAFTGVNGSTSANDTTEVATLFARHVNSSGKVWVGIQGSSLEGGTEMLIDQIIVSYTQTGSAVGYANGEIWVDTVNGVAGTVPNVNGVADNPVDSWADALTLSASVGLTSFHIANGSTITLTGNSDNYTLEGDAWTLALGGQSIVDAHFSGATVSGTSTGAGSEFHDCEMAIVTIAPCTVIDSRFTSAASGGFTLQTAGTFVFHGCSSGVAGNNKPLLTFPGSGSSFVNFRHYSGGIEFDAMTGTDTASIESDGQFVEGTCTGGAVTLRGCQTVSGITNITLTDEARYEVQQVTGGAYALDTDANGRVRIVDGTGAGEINTNAGAIVSVTTTDTATALGANAVNTTSVQDGTLTAAKIGADAITNAKIADDAIAAENLATGALTADAFAANALIAATFAASSLDGKGDWNTVVPDPAGTAPTAVENRQEMDSNSTRLAAIETDTGEIGTAGAGLTDLGGMSAGMKAEVNAEVVDVMTVDTLTLPGQTALTNTPTFAEAVTANYKNLRNKKTQTASQWSLLADDATTIDQKATVSNDGTTTTKGEIESGP